MTVSPATQWTTKVTNLWSIKIIDCSLFESNQNFSVKCWLYHLSCTKAYQVFINTAAPVAVTDAPLISSSSTIDGGGVVT